MAKGGASSSSTRGHSSKRGRGGRGRGGSRKFERDRKGAGSDSFRPESAIDSVEGDEDEEDEDNAAGTSPLI